LTRRGDGRTLAADMPFQIEGTKATLRIRSSGGRDLGPVITMLVDLQQAYVAAYIFFTAPPKQLVSLARLEAKGTAELPMLTDLVLSRVTLSSPGFWEFVGSLNPLKVLVDYLQQAHERKKDEDYRNNAERDKLALENELLRNRVIKERVELLQNVGFNNAELKGLMTTYLSEPLLKTREHVNSGLIEGAGISDVLKERPE
jgi:hypothetical protein